jgi:hypothetical protein
MGRPIKANKWNGSTNIDYGYPNDGTTDNGYDTDKPGVVIGDPEDRWEIVQSYVCIKVNGLGTITTDSTATTVTGTGTNFTGLLLGGAKLYTSAGVYIGTVDSVTDDGELELAANAEVDVTDSAFYYGDADSEGIILRQKGKRKFLVARRDNIQDEYIVAGNTYFIDTVGNTDWEALGAGVGAGYGKVFTATANGTGLGTDGSVYNVGICSLVDTTDSTELEPGEMYISYYDPVQDDTYAASELTNHWLRPWGAQASATKYVAQLTDSSSTPDPATGYTSVDVNDWD